MEVTGNTPEADDALLVRKYFDPVAAELGLRAPNVEADDLSAEVLYFADHLGLQVAVDRRDFFPFVHVFQHANQAFPRILDDAERKRLRPSLLQVAQRLRLPYRTHLELRALVGSASRRDAMLAVASEAARHWWPIVRAREAEVFGP